jgi:hypothetical protein
VVDRKSIIQDENTWHAFAGSQPFKRIIRQGRTVVRENDPIIHGGPGQNVRVGDAGKADVDKYLAALRRAQMEIDLRPELYKHYHLRSVPEKYRDQVDVRAFGTGERIVFLEYTRENFEATRQWTQAHDLFSGPPSAGYDQAALV